MRSACSGDPMRSCRPGFENARGRFAVGRRMASTNRPRLPVIRPHPLPATNPPLVLKLCNAHKYKGRNAEFLRRIARLGYEYDHIALEFRRAGRGALRRQPPDGSTCTSQWRFCRLASDESADGLRLGWGQQSSLSIPEQRPGQPRGNHCTACAAHRRASAGAQRAQELSERLGCVLVAQDTTSFAFSKQGVSGVSYLERKGRRGIFMHTALALSTEGEVLGQLAQHQWVREDQDYGKKALRKSTPSDQKESDIWRCVRDTARQALPESVQMISLMDREADIFALLAAPRPANTDYIIRVAQKKRAVYDASLTSEDDTDVTAAKLIELLEAQAPTAQSMSAEIGREEDRPPRTATLSVRFMAVTIPAPKGRAPEATVLAPVTVNVILVREDHPPIGQTAIEWVLVTTLAVTSFEDAKRCVEYYSKRWLIERFHYTLKSGLHIEELQLENRARLSNAIALLSVVAWHLMHILYHARVHPDASCEQALEPAQWKALVLRQQRGKHTRLPSEPPSMKQVMLWIAQLGGYRGRAAKDRPGIKTLWRGLRRLADMTETYNDMHRLLTASPSGLVGIA